MTNPINDLFAAALGIAAPWFVDRVDFDTGQRKLTIHVDFKRGSRFRHPKAPGEHSVHDTEVKRLRHLNFFQHECYLEVRFHGSSCRMVEWRWWTLTGSASSPASPCCSRRWY